MCLGIIKSRGQWSSKTKRERGRAEQTVVAATVCGVVAGGARCVSREETLLSVAHVTVLLSRLPIWTSSRGASVVQNGHTLIDRRGVKRRSCIAREMKLLSVKLKTKASSEGVKQ